MKRIFLIVAVLVLIHTTSSASTKTRPIGFSIPFPHLTFSQRLTERDLSYLGLSPKTKFSLREIQAELLLIEVLSTYCVNCQKQAPLIAQLHGAIEKDPALKGKVKILGIAAGNTSDEVEAFRKEHQIPYPILSDPKFHAHEAIGSPRTPFTVWTRKDRKGTLLVVSTHLGLIESMEKILAETRNVLQYDLALLQPKKGAVYEGGDLKPPVSEEELLAKVKKGMEASGTRILELKKVSLKDGDTVFVGRVESGGRQENLFAKLASRRAVCDVCHDTFFFYVFNTAGRVIDLIPVQLTKNNNLHWTEDDIKKLRSRTIGRSILKPFSFDPSVDSISGATITAALIFDSLDKGKTVFEKLKGEGYIK